MTTKDIFKSIVRYFLSGLLYVAPISLTVFALYQLFVFLDNVIPIDIPGLGLLILILVITLAGVLGSSFLFIPLVRYLEEVIDRIPLVKTIYNSIRDLLSAFVGDKKRFTKPVIVQMNADGLSKLGFITAEDLQTLGIDDGRIAVYLPHSINFSGNLYIVSPDKVAALDTSASEVMKFIVSGGVIDITPTTTQKEEEL